MACRSGFVFALAAAVLASWAEGSPHFSAIAGEKASGTGPFGLSSVMANEGPLWTRWRAVGSRIRAEESQLLACRVACHNAAVARFLAIVENARRLNGHAKFEIVNREINTSIRYRLEHYDGQEVWHAPIATFARGYGDCMDISIAKYVALREAGVSNNDLQILIGELKSKRAPHAVVAARDGGHWFILDNAHDEIREDVQARDYSASFSINEDGVKQFDRSFRLKEFLSQPPSVLRRGLIGRC